MPKSVGEFYYDMAYVVILIFLLPLFFLCIPCLVLHHIQHPTYNYLATSDAPPVINGADLTEAAH